MQLGIGKESEFETLTKVTEAPKNITNLSLGGNHTLAIDKDSYLWAVGWNNKGQLGIGSTEDVSKFVKLNHKFSRVSCGFNSSAGITSDGRLFIWGGNHHNQLGFSKTDHESFLSPTELILPFNETAQDIQFGLRHTVILTESNQIFIVGGLRHFKKNKHKIFTHNSIEYLNFVPKTKIRQMTCGQNHVLLLDCENLLFGLGDNRFMQCTELKPKEKVVEISSGWNHNAFLTDSGKLYVYGRNNFGQCGNGLRSEFETPQKCINVQPVERFKLGAEHGILLSKGEVYTFGWNEHGNCGNGSFDDL